MAAHTAGAAGAQLQPKDQEAWAGLPALSRLQLLLLEWKHRSGHHAPGLPATLSTLMALTCQEPLFDSPSGLPDDRILSQDLRPLQQLTHCP